MCTNRTGESGGDEHGFTLPELMVVTLMLGIVSIVLLTTLISITRTSAGAQGKAQALADARTALEVVARDLRAANPVDAVTPETDYRNQVRFSVYCSTPGVNGCTSQNLRQVLYRVVDYRLERVSAGNTRVLLGPSGPSGLPPEQQVGAVINGSTEAVFAYFKADGSELVTQGSTPPAEKFRDCTKSVVIRLAVVSEPRQVDRRIDLSTEVNLRNFNEVSGCF